MRIETTYLLYLLLHYGLVTGIVMVLSTLLLAFISKKGIVDSRAAGGGMGGGFGGGG